MSTFYVLPPRRFLGDHLAAFLASWLPGLEWSETARRVLAEQATAAAAHVDVFILHREDLPDGADIMSALMDGFGAQAGDEVVEVRAGDGPGGLAVRRWRMGITPHTSSAA